ncbi:4168_t:CDS:2, partial [Cetraspora pellucida]
KMSDNFESNQKNKKIQYDEEFHNDNVPHIEYSELKLNLKSVKEGGFSYVSEGTWKEKHIAAKIIKHSKELDINREKIKFEPKIYDYTYESIYNLTDFLEFYETSEDDIYDTEDVHTEKDYKYEFHYGIFIRLDEKVLSTKWYKAVISKINEFLLEIYKNIITLVKNELIKANDYNITFKITGHLVVYEGCRENSEMLGNLETTRDNVVDIDSVASSYHSEASDIFDKNLQTLKELARKSTK